MAVRAYVKTYVFRTGVFELIVYDAVKGDISGLAVCFCFAYGIQQGLDILRYGVVFAFGGVGTYRGQVELNVVPDGFYLP